MKLDRFINRPVLSTVISILIVILGAIGLATLPITQYPDIAPPTVSVRATYTGASASTVLNSVIAPLEEQINGVENMMYMTSTASNTGSGDISIYFKQGTDPDMAAVNVQNRVSMAQGLLPAEVTKVGVTTQKRQTSMLVVFSLYDETDTYSESFIENYAKINLIPQVQRVQGVGDANVLGQDYSMRIWLRPDVMAQYKLVPGDVSAALAEQNVEAAPGQFGERSDQTFQYTIRYKGRLQQPEEFENIVIKSLPDGEVLRLKDIAEIQLDRLGYNFTNRVDGHKSVTCIVYQMAGTNATQTISDIEALLDEASKTLPTGLKLNISMNANDFLFASIHEVVKTLIEAFILVFIVVYIFLQDLRSTLIPTIAIPVALIGTFFILSLVGFSLNLLTLCALVLAIAIVVDDAIVVVEGVHAKLDQGYTSARLASIDAMNELGGAIVYYAGYDGRIRSGKFHGRYSRNILSSVRYDYGYRYRSVRIERIDFESGFVRRSSETSQKRRWNNGRLHIERTYESSLYGSPYNYDQQIYRSYRKDVASGNYTYFDAYCHSRHDLWFVQYQSDSHCNFRSA